MFVQEVPGGQMPHLMNYRHTQSAPAIFFTCAGVLALGVFLGWKIGNWFPAVLLTAIGLVTGVVFVSLTIEVTPSDITWYFGPRWWKYSRSLRQMVDASIVRNSWWNGWGIRYGPGYRLYNVSGLDAVEIRFASGEVIRLGTDDPNGLAAALKQFART